MFSIYYINGNSFHQRRLTCFLVSLTIIVKQLVRSSHRQQRNVLIKNKNIQETVPPHTEKREKREHEFEM
jgi:hypothetical protein